MDQDTAETPVVNHPPVRAVAPPLLPPPGRRGLRRDLLLLALVGVLLLAALAAAAATLYRDFYSPTAFVARYLGLLEAGRAADALALPGVSIDSAQLDAAGLPPTASDALLRRDALAALERVRILSETVDGDVVEVAVAFHAGDYDGTTTFRVESDGWIGIAPAWRFVSSPLAVMELTVRGSTSFEVNGFEVDRRQVSPDGVDADPSAPVALLVFSPGIYSVSVDTEISATAGAAVLSDSPLTAIPVQLQAQPTEEFVGVVQENVAEYLSACATQQVLQPTGCPFGFRVQDRLADLPTWTMVSQPTVALQPDGDSWVIPETEAVARIDVDIRSLFDGRVRSVSEDVPFLVGGTVVIGADGRALITVSGPGTP